MSDLSRHLDVYDNPQYGYPRRVPIDQTSKLRLPHTGKPRVKVGDLVTWYNEDSGWAHRFGKNAVGLVLDSRWMLRDWDERGSVTDTRKWSYIPEAAIMWSNGELTNTSHGAVKKLKLQRCRVNIDLQPNTY